MNLPWNQTRLGAVPGISIQLVLLICAGPGDLHSDEPVELDPLPMIESGKSFKFASNTSDTSSSSPAFHAVNSTTWPNGLVPLFGYEVRGVSRLSRKPKTGWENLMEPLFFALPANHETNVAQVTGAWYVSASHIGDHTDEFSWELTVADDRVAGRFDLHTDYRFATLSSGTLRSKRIDLKVDYINDHFEITGNLQPGKLSGTWRRTDDGDMGEWTARRLHPNPVLQTNGFQTVPLYQWTHRETKEHRYSVGPLNEDDFERDSKPLCHVWTPAEHRSENQPTTEAP